MRQHWGSVIARELTKLAPLVVAGCASAPPPEAPPPPPPAPAPVVVAPSKKAPDFSDPPGAKNGLSAFTPIVPVSAASEVVLPPETQGWVIAYGKGVAQIVHLTGPNNVCLLPQPDGGSCDFMRVAPWKTPRDRAGWERPARDNDVGAWGAFVPVSSDFGNLSAGSDGLYALRRASTLAIDTIDDKGKVSPLFDGVGAPSLIDVRLVETASGLLAVGVDGESPSLNAVGLRKKDGGGMTASPLTPLNIAMVGDEGNAAQARWMMESKRRIGYGTWDLLAGVDDKGNADKVVYLAWTEAIAPAKYTPRGVAKKGKHGCGGRPSRPLSDASVEKKTHLTILGDDGHVIGDHLLPIPAPVDEAPVLSLAAMPGGIEVNGVKVGKDGRVKDAAPKPVAPPGPLTPPPLVGPVLQHLEAAAFDAKSGEGLVIFSEKDDQRAVRFDARGAPVGSPIDITNHLQLGPRASARIVRTEAGWVGLEQGGDAVVVLDGPSAGKRIAIASDRSWVLPKGAAWLFPIDDTHVQVVRFVPLPKTYLLEIGVGDPSLSRGLMLSTVDIATGNSTPWSLASGWFAGESVTPRLNEVSIGTRTADGSLIFVGRGSEGSWRQVRRNADGSWAAPVLMGEGGDVRAAMSHYVWGDMVTVLSGSHPLATWLESGKTLPLDTVGAEIALQGPLLHGTPLALPAEAGAPVKLPPEVTKHEPQCPLSFATGPSRAVMLCEEAVDPARLSSRVGTRVVRF